MQRQKHLICSGKEQRIVTFSIQVNIKYGFSGKTEKINKKIRKKRYRLGALEKKLNADHPLYPGQCDYGYLSLIFAFDQPKRISLSLNC
jgi:hypothetical protein